MQKLINKKNITLIIMLALLATVVFMLFAWNGTPALAEGNDAGAPRTTPDVVLTIDVNGKDASAHQTDITVGTATYRSYKDNDLSKISVNNALFLRRRIVDIQAIVESYNDNQANSDKISDSDKFSYKISAVKSDIYNDCSAVSVVASDDGLSLFVEALSAVTDGRFSVLIVDSNPSGSLPAKRVYFKVVITNTFVQYRSDSAGWQGFTSGEKTLKVGGVLSNGVEAEIADSTKAIMEIENFTEKDFSLDEYFVNRALYCNSGKTALIMSPDLTAVNSRKWGISSAANFVVTDIRLPSGSGAFKNTLITNPTVGAAVAPRIRTTLNLTKKIIGDYADTKYSGLDETEQIKKFWASAHDVQVELTELNSSTKIVIVIPTKFLPSTPVYEGVTSSLFNFNVTSDYICDMSSGRDPKKYTYLKVDEEGKEVAVTNYDPTAGYSAAIVSPATFVEYSAPSNWAPDGIFMRFYDSVCTQSVTGSYKIENLDEARPSRPQKYKITIEGNENFNLHFGVDYYNASFGVVNEETGETNISSTPLEFTITVTGYGKYSIKLPPIKGKKEVTYNALTAPEFNSLIKAGFQMIDAQSNNDYQLAAFFTNNTLTLTPRVDNIPGTATATVTLTFKNSRGQTVKIETNTIDIDVNALEFFQQFEAEWQGWLVIVACIVAGILLILLIVWLFIHSISKHKQEEAAAQAPVSSYIVKLNSTIAANQAQQRIAATQALTQANTQMLLGAGPVGGPAPSPDTLQLTSGVPSQPASQPASQPLDSTPSAPAPTQESREDLEKLIAQYITDEELLERIFTEKYEPRGMVRRTFFKSKDLQARELEKEKDRIIERYKTPMPMDEAIMSEEQIKKGEQSSTPSQPQAAVEQEVGAYDLGFDPDAPLYTEAPVVQDEFSEEKIEVDVAPEQSRLNEIEKQNDILQREMAELKSRMDKVQAELDKNSNSERELEEKIAKAEADNEQFEKDISDLEFKLASAKNKEKEKIKRDIKIKEEKIDRNKRDIEKWRADLEALRNSGSSLGEIMARLNDTQTEKNNQQQAITSDLDKAKADYAAYQDRLAKVKARQELDTKIEGLTPLLVAVNTADYELRQLENLTEHEEKERAQLKSDMESARSQLMSINDFDIMNELQGRITDANARISEIEKDITKSAKRRTELNVEFKTQRRKANEFVEKNDIPLEELIAAEDAVIGNIELETLKFNYEKEREEAEKAVAAAQAVYDDISASAGDVTMIALQVAADIKDIEDELARTQAELDEINAQMEAASDDEKLMLMVDQGDKSEKVEELKEKLKQANLEGTKKKMEAQSEYDGKLDAARHALDEANAEFKRACAKYDDIINNTNPSDLVVSGSGVISQDQKRIEAENLKKQLEKSKNEIEQARLAAQMAQMEAEQARVDAARASDEAKAEAERKAQEALELAEKARLEAEEKARSETEAADAARREAEEAAEQARREAEEAVEQARREAEEAADAARREAEAAVQAEAEEAKRRAQEEIEEMRRKAEAEAEAKRREDEERQRAEAERKEVINKKVVKRKEQIIEIRNSIKDIKNEEDAKNLREKLYTAQLSYDEDERGSSELMDFYNKTLDDIQHAGEVATLKAENAKKPQRVVKKVTERVNRIPKHKSGQRQAGARTNAQRPAGARPAGARPAGARPAGARPAGARPAGARPAGARPAGARPAGARPAGARPAGSRPRPNGQRPTKK